MYITERKIMKWALYSNAIYIMLLFLVKPQGINFQKITITLLLSFSVISIVHISYRSRKLLHLLPKYTRLNFYLLLFWGSIVIIRGFSFSLQDWVTNFGNVYMGMAWIVPSVLILGLKIENWSIIFKAIKFMFKLMIFAFLLYPFYDMKTEWTWLLRPVNFIILMGLYRFKLIDKIGFFLIIGVYFVIAISVDQRMEFLYLALVLALLFIDKVFSIKIKKRFLKYIFGSFILVFTFIFTIGYEDLSYLISLVVEYQDTRTFLYQELFLDLNFFEELFGKGSLGTQFSEFFAGTRRYYDAIGNTTWKGDNPIRITTEVGYLQMLLKGGYTLLILNILISFNASYVAIFKSNNKFVRRLGYYILIISALSLISFRPAFTPTFIIFWMAIGTVLNKNYRAMDDDEINKLIKF